MHVPDGFLDATTSVATGAAAAAAVGLALRQARHELDERTVPLAGLTSAFIFAVQMINFPVGVGTSGHLMGGALAAALVGPWTGLLCVSVVLLIQALLFADGGLTAMGTNITLIGVVTVAVGWGVTKAVLAVLPRRQASVTPAVAVGALLSVPAAAGVFVLLYAVGGQVGLPFGTLLATMLGWHILIAIGEAVITALTVGAVLAVRPDLVYAARGLQPVLQLKQADGSMVAAESPHLGGSPQGARSLLVGGGLVALAIAGVLSFFASGHPDGLEYVAEDQGFIDTARDHAFGGFALADYGDVGSVPVGLAGVLGAVVTVALGWLVVRAVGVDRRDRNGRYGRRGRYDRREAAHQG